MTTPESVIADKHRDLVASLIALSGSDTNRADNLRWMIDEYEKAFPCLEHTRIEMMSKKLKESDSGTGDEGRV